MRVCGRVSIYVSSGLLVECHHAPRPLPALLLSVIEAIWGRQTHHVVMGPQEERHEGGLTRASHLGRRARHVVGCICHALRVKSARVLNICGDKLAKSLGEMCVGRLAPPSCSLPLPPSLQPLT